MNSSNQSIQPISFIGVDTSLDTISNLDEILTKTSPENNEVT
jgi:hypothetical protein